MSQLYEIITIPDPVLKTKAAEVNNLDESIKSQIERMIHTMHDGNGIGLAANQVGLLNRICIVDVPDDYWQFGPAQNGILPIEKGINPENAEHNPIAMINPEIVWESEEKSVYEEGCLSIPGHYANVIRPAHVKVRFLDKDGKKHEMDSHGLHAHCVQHEIDHLNGVLFIDHLSTLKRNMIVKKFQKQKKVL